MKGIEINPETELQIDLDVTSYIPDEYISDANQKIEIYQNIALCRNEQDIQNVTDEIIDRFGNMPTEVENLISIARIKYKAKSLKISKITSKNGIALFTFVANTTNKQEINIKKLVEKYGNKIKFSNGIKPTITLKTQTNTNNEKQTLSTITEFLVTLGTDPN